MPGSTAVLSLENVTDVPPQCIQRKTHYFKVESLPLVNNAFEWGGVFRAWGGGIYA